MFSSFKQPQHGEKLPLGSNVSIEILLHINGLKTFEYSWLNNQNYFSFAKVSVYLFVSDPTSTSCLVKSSPYLSCDTEIPLEPLSMPADNTAWMPSLNMDSKVELSMRDLCQKETSAKQILKIGSLQDSVLYALSTYFDDLSGEPMFLALLDLLANSIKDTMKLSTVEALSNIHLRRDAFMKPSTLDVSDKVKLRNAPVTDTTDLFPADMLNKVIEKKRAASHDVALNKMVHGQNRSNYQVSNRGRGSASATHSQTGRGGHQQQQQRPSVPAKRAAAHHPHAGGDAKRGRQDESAPSANR